MKKLLTLLCCAAFLAADAKDTDTAKAVKRVRELEAQRVALADKLTPAVCAVFKGGGGGSGVIITPDGLVLSNYHVTGLAAEMRIGLNDHRIHPAVVIGIDPSGDLSLLRLTEKRTDWAYSPLGDSDALKQGDWVYAMGNPFLLATDFTPTVTMGVVSAINRYQPGSVRGQLLYPDCIQTDASINPGNSGGPLFNFLGQVVGINGRVSLRDRGRVNIGVGYAISSNQIKYCLPDLRAGLVVQHGTLNALVRDDQDPKWPGGIRVTFHQLLMPSCASEAGIQVGDALVEFQGQKVWEANDFLRQISVLPKGRRVSLKVAGYADGKWTTRDVSLRLDGLQLIKKSDEAKRVVPRIYLDHEIERTLAAARRALQPIANEVRTGKLTVTGRDGKALKEMYSGPRVTLQIGDDVRTATADGGVSGGKPMEKDRVFDLLERRDYWNDLVAPDGLKHFESVTFTGGALVSGKTADRLEAKTKDGVERVYFVDLESGRLLRVDLYAKGWVRWISLMLSDWKKGAELLRPHRVEVWDRDKEKLLQTIEYEAIQQS
jgi:S1-C subfamily serine protease